MEEAAAAATPARTPIHLWIVGILSLLWNTFGAYDYTMTQTHNAAWLAGFTEAQRAYFDSFPAWMDAAWAFGVWGALLGSLLLLIRSRFAAWAFAASLLGLAASTGYQQLLTPMPEGTADGSMIMLTIAIWVIAIALLVYAHRMEAKGLLR